MVETIFVVPRVICPKCRISGPTNTMIDGMHEDCRRENIILERAKEIMREIITRAKKHCDIGVDIQELRSMKHARSVASQLLQSLRRYFGALSVGLGKEVNVLVERAKALASTLKLSMPEFVT